jgi:hypothetical protein
LTFFKASPPFLKPVKGENGILPIAVRRRRANRQKIAPVASLAVTYELAKIQLNDRLVDG